MQYCKNFVEKSGYAGRGSIQKNCVGVFVRQQARGLHSGGPHLYTTGTGEWPLYRCGWLRILWRWEPVKRSEICVEFVDFLEFLNIGQCENSCNQEWHQQLQFLAKILVNCNHARPGRPSYFKHFWRVPRCSPTWDRLEVDDANNFRRIGEPTEVQRWKHGMDLQDWWIGNSLSVLHT